MISIQTGNLLDAKAEALVNTVNTAGVMGKGVALQFKRRYPENYRAYVAACKAGEVIIGQMFVTQLPADLKGGPRYVINFPTKRHWRGSSRLSYIESGLIDLLRVTQEYGIQSVAVPALGCGNGGLDWGTVHGRIEAAFSALPQLEVLLYPPQAEPETALKSAGQSRAPKLTLGSAAMLRVFHEYLLPDYTLGRTEAQKLMYFLQAAGADLKLRFTKGEFGPYDPNIQHMLERLEGHYTTGLGAGGQPSQLQLLPSALPAAQAVLGATDLEVPLERVALLIEGFETPASLELLATVHWVWRHEDARDCASALARIAQWNERKQRVMTPERVELAWHHLQGQGWFNA